ncbi:MAG: prevent-host-death protein [Lachnospira sp.]
MPNIKPISDLRNYTAVINEVTYGNHVYLTRNGHGQCAIIDMKELDELDKQKALYQFMSKLNEAEMYQCFWQEIMYINTQGVKVVKVYAVR